jgi:hypothetical protein
MDNNNKSYSPSSMPKGGARSIGTSWGVKGDKLVNSIGGTRSSYKIDHSYSSNNTNNIDNKMNGSFIHSYQPGRYAGLHEPGTYSRPVFGVNPDTYFLGNQRYFPTPFQPPSINDNVTRSLINGSGVKKGVQGHGWGHKTMYPMIDMPVNIVPSSKFVQNLEKKKEIKKNKKQQNLKAINKNVKDFYVI